MLQSRLDLLLTLIKQEADKRTAIIAKILIQRGPQTFKELLNIINFEKKYHKDQSDYLWLYNKKNLRNHLLLTLKIGIIMAEAKDFGEKEKQLITFYDVDKGYLYTQNSLGYFLEKQSPNIQEAVKIGLRDSIFTYENLKQELKLNDDNGLKLMRELVNLQIVKIADYTRDSKPSVEQNKNQIFIEKQQQEPNDNSDKKNGAGKKKQTKKETKKETKATKAQAKIQQIVKEQNIVQQVAPVNNQQELNNLINDPVTSNPLMFRLNYGKILIHIKNQIFYEECENRYGQNFADLIDVLGKFQDGKTGMPQFSDFMKQYPLLNAPMIKRLQLLIGIREDDDYFDRQWLQALKKQMVNDHIQDFLAQKYDQHHARILKAIVFMKQADCKLLTERCMIHGSVVRKIVTNLYKDQLINEQELHIGGKNVNVFTTNENKIHLGYQSFIFKAFTNILVQIQQTENLIDELEKKLISGLSREEDLNKAQEKLLSLQSAQNIYQKRLMWVV